MTTYENVFNDGLYQYMVGPSYEDYINRSVERILSFSGDAETVLSVGCGNGDVEEKINNLFDLTVYDTHDAAKKKHSELHYLPHLPNSQFDYVYAHGSVFACVPQEDKQRFIDDLAARVKDGGTLYICAGNLKNCSCCRARAYSVGGKTVTEAVTKRGNGWHILTTHIWGVAKVDITYYPCKLEEFFIPHKDRIHCVTAGMDRNGVLKSTPTTAIQE